MEAQSTHRVAMTTFWRTFYHDGNISPAWCGWGVHTHPLSLYLTSRTKLRCTLQLRGQIHFPYFFSTPIGTLWTRGCGRPPTPLLCTPPPARRGKVVVFEHVPDSVPADFMLCNTRIQIAGSLPAGHCQSTQCAPARLLWDG
jgi:hypothetical protein